MQAGRADVVVARLGGVVVVVMMMVVMVLVSVPVSLRTVD
jgi:hypothetical protein